MRSAAGPIGSSNCEPLPAGPVWVTKAALPVPASPTDRVPLPPGAAEQSKAQLSSQRLPAGLNDGVAPVPCDETRGNKTTLAPPPEDATSVVVVAPAGTGRANGAGGED